MRYQQSKKMAKSENPIDLLPEEVWFRILEFGVQKQILFLKDIASISISCKLFNKLLNEDALWSRLIALDFPPYASDDRTLSSFLPTKKLLYKHTLGRYVLSKANTARRNLYVIDTRLFRFRSGVRLFRNAILGVNSRMEMLSERLLNLINNSVGTLSPEEMEALERLRQRIVDVAEESVAIMDNSDQDPSASVDYLANASSLSKSDGPSTPSSLVDLVADTNELFTFHRSVLSQHQEVQCQIYNSLCEQEQHMKELETLDAFFDSLCSGPNPIEISDDSEVEDVDVDFDVGFDFGFEVNDGIDNDNDNNNDNGNGGD